MTLDGANVTAYFTCVLAPVIGCKTANALLLGIMQRVLVYESLKFHPRDGLERLQMFSRALRNMVVAGSNLLPLRTIDRVDLVC